MFLAAVGREYLVLLRDQHGVPVTADAQIAPFKMTPSERIDFRFCQKAPMQDGALWADVRLTGDTSAFINPMNIGWENPGPISTTYAPQPDALVDYAAQVCSHGEYEQCLDDPYWRAPELARPMRIDSATGGVVSDLVARATGRRFAGGLLVPSLYARATVTRTGVCEQYALKLGPSGTVPNDAAALYPELACYEDTEWDLEYGGTRVSDVDVSRWRYGYDRAGYGGWHAGVDPTTYEGACAHTVATAPTRAGTRRGGTRAGRSGASRTARGDPERALSAVLPRPRASELRARGRAGDVRDGASGARVALYRCDASQYQDWVWTGAGTAASPFEPRSATTRACRTRRSASCVSGSRSSRPTMAPASACSARIAATCPRRRGSWARRAARSRGTAGSSSLTT